MGRKARPPRRAAGMRVAAAVKPTPSEAQWAIVTYASQTAHGAGYFLDSFIAGSKADALIEAQAAQASSEGMGYASTFVAPLKHGFRCLTDTPVQPVDVWLHRRNANGEMEHAVSATRAADSPVPPADGEEWQVIMLARAWLPPAASEKTAAAAAAAPRAISAA